MFFGLAAIIPRVAGAEPEVVNAIKESLLIHARVLMDFFGPTRTKDDLMAFDYIDDWNSESHGGGGAGLAGRLARPVHRQARCSSDRLSRPCTEGGRRPVHR